MGTSYPASAVVKQEPLNVETTPSALREPITRNDEFYVRTNVGVPRLSAADYALRLRDLAGAEQRITLDKLRALDPVRITVTLECAGNHRSTIVPLPRGETWRGGAVATAEWTGVPLRRVLEQYCLAGKATHFLFTGSDGGSLADGRRVVFQRALPAELAAGDGPLLAFEMNGAPLPPEHGAPLRLLMPGWYAMASVKWLASIEALDAPFTGYFQRERYVYRTPAAQQPVRRMRVKSMLSEPGDGAVIPGGRVKLRGWAWSGEAPVQAVHVALHGAGEWRPARLGPELSRWAWRSWELDWEPDGPGHYILHTRATDASGATQLDVAEWNELGYGNNAIQTHSVIVV